MEQTFEALKNLAEQGDTETMYQIGNCYQNGEGVEPDIEKAIEWWLKAADLGHEKASELIQKLKFLQAVFNRENLKSLSKNFKKGVQVGVLGSALIMGGCSTEPSDDNTIDTPQVIEKPTNGGQTNGGNQQGNNGNEQNNNGNQQGNNGNNGNTGNEQNNNGNQQGNNGNTGNEQNNNSNTGNEQGNTGNQQGNEQGNTGNEQTQTVTYGKDREIGNGNYILHNFKDNGTAFYAEDTVTAMNKCLSEAESYVKGLANNLDESLNGRAQAKDYFADLVNNVNADKWFYIDTQATYRETFDIGIDALADAARPYITDIIKNLNTENDRYGFYIAYRVLANESYKEGLGTYFQYGSSQKTAYNNEKDSIISWAEADKTDGGLFTDINLEQAYLNNNFTQVTTLLDSLVTKVANKMSSKNIQVNDLRQVINLSLTSNSLTGLHDLTAANLNHKKSNCSLSANMNATMEDAINTPYNTTTTTQNQEMGL